MRALEEALENFAGLLPGGSDPVILRYFSGVTAFASG